MTSSKATYSLSEVAGLLGKTHRQVRYMVQTGQLKGQRTEQGRWRVHKEDLPIEVTDAQLEDVQRLTAAAKSQAPAKPDRYSVQDLRAFQAGAPLYRDALATWGHEDQVTMRLRHALERITLGCHAFSPDQKINHFENAREALAVVVADLLLSSESEDDARMTLSDRIETELLPRVGGLIRAAERQERNARFSSFGARRRR